MYDDYDQREANIVFFNGIVNIRCKTGELCKNGLTCYKQRYIALRSIMCIWFSKKHTLLKMDVFYAIQSDFYFRCWNIIYFLSFYSTTFGGNRNN